MNDWNNILMTGHLTEDAQLKYTPQGTPVVTFSLAVNKSWKDKSGEWKEEVYYFDTHWFGKTAEATVRSLVKGVPVIVQGSLKQERWQGKDGEARTAVKITLDDVRIQQAAIKKESVGTRAPQKVQNIPEPDRFDDDGIPF